MAKKGFSRLPAEDWRTPDMAATLEGEAGARLFGVSPDLPKIVEIDLDNIDSNPHQPRKSFDQEKLDSLAANIEKHGLKYPILVSRNNGRFLIVGGERRYRAHRQLARTSIAAIIVDGDTDEVGLIDNLQRVDLNALEMANAFERLMSRHGYTQEQLGQTVGRSKAEVSNILGLRRLAEQIRSEYPDFAAIVGARTLCEIAREKDGDKQLALWARAKSGEGVLAIRNRIKQRDEAEAPAPQPEYVPAVRMVGLLLKRTGQQVTKLLHLRPALTEQHRNDLRLLRSQIDILLAD
ncbi:MAG: ParB/RepB/Spo0J family partition protein [Rhodospirillaceae bacterium]